MKKLYFFSVIALCFQVRAQYPCLKQPAGSPYSAGTGTANCFSTYINDLNNDGKPDLVTVNTSSTTNQHVAVWLNNGTGNLGAAAHYSAQAIVNYAFVRDLNGDGFADIAAYNVGTGTGAMLTVLLNQGNGSFSSSLTYSAINCSSAYNPVLKLQDLNGDLKPDFVATSQMGNEVCVSLNNGNGTFTTTPTSYTVGNTPDDLSLTDVNADGSLDIVVVNQNSNNVSVLINNGNGTFANGVTYVITNAQTNLFLQDLNGDSRPDIITNSTFGNGASVLLNNGNGTYSASTTYFTFNNIFIGDMNGDNKPDIVSYYLNTNPTSIKVFLNNGSGVFAAQTAFSITTTPASECYFKDLNNDGASDVVITYSAGYSISMNNGNATFSPAKFYNLGTSINGYSLIFSDLLMNGKQDIILLCPSKNEIITMVNDGTGNFGTPFPTSVGTNPTNLLIADLDGNSRPDIIAGNQTSNNLNVFLNNTPDTVSGTITLPNASPLASGTVYVFKQQTGGHLDTAGFASIGPTGQYIFPYLPAANYFIQAVPGTGYSNAVSTYYSNKPNNYRWDSAVFINHNGCNGAHFSGYNVQVIEFVPPTGAGSIGGNINSLASYGHRGINGSQQITGAVKGVDVKLGKRPAGGCANRTSSDNNGNFNFANVDTGSYSIFVDLPNFIDTIAYVTVSPGNLNSINNNFCVDSVKVHYCTVAGINQLSASNSDLKISPNPSNGIFEIKGYNIGFLRVHVYDVNGKKVFYEELHNKTHVDISGLKEGIYNLQIQNEHGFDCRKIVIVK